MAKKRGRDLRGILLLDKPAGPTSNRALERVKRLYGAAKAGHAGSLDPLATGMLPICFGSATKLAAFLLDSGKSYAVTAQFGAATATGDSEGEVVARSEAPAPTEEALRAALDGFVGDILQIPPMYSALKQGGVRLYELARRGIEVEREPRQVRIHAIELDEYRWPVCRFSVSCSKGTYVRSLVMDLAVAVGTLGHVTALRRTAVEPFPADGMVTLEQLEQDAERGFAALDARLLPPEDALAGWPVAVLDAAAAGRWLQGQAVAAATVPEPPSEMTVSSAPETLVRVDGPQGFIGVGEMLGDGRVAPRRPMPPL